MSDSDRKARDQARANAHRNLPPAHDRDAINAAAQRHPGKPFQGSATRADDGTPVSTTEHPAHAALLDPETSGQAAGTLALPGDTEPLPAGNAPTDAIASSRVSNPGDPDAPRDPNVRDTDELDAEHTPVADPGKAGSTAQAETAIAAQTGSPTPPAATVPTGSPPASS